MKKMCRLLQDVDEDIKGHFPNLEETVHEQKCDKEICNRSKKKAD